MRKPAFAVSGQSRRGYGYMVRDFIQTIHCRSRVHCVACRTDEIWRATVGAPAACPFGVSVAGLGDKIAVIATPIARILKLPCIDPSTGKLKEESGCAKRKKKLNEFGRKLLGQSAAPMPHKPSRPGDGKQEEERPEYPMTGGS